METFRFNEKSFQFHDRFAIWFEEKVRWKLKKCRNQKKLFKIIINLNISLVVIYRSLHVTRIVDDWSNTKFCSDFKSAVKSLKPIPITIWVSKRNASYLIDCENSFSSKIFDARVKISLATGYLLGQYVQSLIHWSSAPFRSFFECNFNEQIHYHWIIIEWFISGFSSQEHRKMNCKLQTITKRNNGMEVLFMRKVFLHFISELNKVAKC